MPIYNMLLQQNIQENIYTLDSWFHYGMINKTLEGAHVFYSNLPDPVAVSLMEATYTEGYMMSHLRMHVN